MSDEVVVSIALRPFLSIVDINGIPPLFTNLPFSSSVPKFRSEVEIVTLNPKP